MARIAEDEERDRPPPKKPGLADRLKQGIGEIGLRLNVPGAGAALDTMRRYSAPIDEDREIRDAVNRGEYGGPVGPKPPDLRNVASGAIAGAALGPIAVGPRGAQALAPQSGGMGNVRMFEGRNPVIEEDLEIKPKPTARPTSDELSVIQKRIAQIRARSPFGDDSLGENYVGELSELRERAAALNLSRSVRDREVRSSPSFGSERIMGLSSTPESIAQADKILTDQEAMQAKRQTRRTEMETEEDELRRAGHGAAKRELEAVGRVSPIQALEEEIRTNELKGQLPGVQQTAATGLTPEELAAGGQSLRAPIENVARDPSSLGAARGQIDDMKTTLARISLRPAAQQQSAARALLSQIGDTQAMDEALEGYFRGDVSTLRELALAPGGPAINYLVKWLTGRSLAERTAALARESDQEVAKEIRDTIQRLRFMADGEPGMR